VGNHGGVDHVPHAVTDDLRQSRIQPLQPQGSTPCQGDPFSSATPWTAWRRRWLEPIVVVTIIIALATTLATGVMAEFRSVKTDIQTSEARLREEIQASEARQNKRADELKTDIRAMNERLDAMNERLGRVLETLPAAKA